MQSSETENPEILLHLLESIGRDGESSQRVRASEFGIALGLVNSYIKFCVRKGYIKVKRIPAQRYFYFLTPKGFAEKSRLTVFLLSNSLAFFRQARADCATVFKTAEARGWRRVALAGASELAEISALCALETGITITAVVDAEFTTERFIGLPVVRSLDAAAPYDGVVITDRFSPQESYNAATAIAGAERVLAPSLLNVAASKVKAAA
jgi:DNA-binding MarR family transcriptional regulator